MADENTVSAGTDPALPDPAAGGSAPWYEGADEETVGYFQNRGLDKGDAKAAAFSAAKAHREAEKLIGAPASEIVRLPKDANDPAWKGIYQRLGVPEDPAKYDFSTVRFADDTPLDTDFSKFLQDSFHTNNVPASAASGFVRDFTKLVDAKSAADQAAHKVLVEAEQEKLNKNWGANYARNLEVAETAAKRLGVTVETVDALKTLPGAGHANVLEMFRLIGEKMGEDGFVKGDSNINIASVSGARARLEELKRDKEWVAKFNKGDTASVTEFNRLTELLVA